MDAVVSNGSKILIWKQITTIMLMFRTILSCFQWFKDTNLKANHNALAWLTNLGFVVSNGSKILIWKQITTLLRCGWIRTSCFQWFKDTNLKANHNNLVLLGLKHGVVSNGSKILIWKQITTPRNVGCNRIVVSNGSKILIWKQITTGVLPASQYGSLFPMVQRY